MINVTVRYDGCERKIDFPCLSEILDSKLKELGVRDLTEAKMFVTQVNDYKLFSFMEDDFIDLDELNLLAYRLDTLDTKEIRKFECVVEQYNIKKLPELINLTSNLHRYTLIQDMRSAEVIGRTHYLTRNQAMSKEEEKTIDFVKIGKELVNSGMGRFTEYGMLFANDDIPAENTYNGIPAPENLYGDKSVEISITKADKKLFLWLPEKENTINRMLKRINSSLTDNDYEVKFEYYEGENEEWRSRLKEILEDNGLQTLNAVVKSINSLGAENELEKLSALMEYAKTSDYEDIIKLASNIDKFHFIEGATEYSDMAEHVIDELEDYHISIELHDYFDDRKFGEDQMNEKNGRFVDNGIVYMKDGCSLQQILGHDEIERVEEQMMQGITGM